jgi:hypothetical protein
MSWGSHPDTMTMNGASNLAKNQTGETNTLNYLKAYRAAYFVLADGERGVAKYISSIDSKIASLEKGEKSNVFVIIPMME